MNKVLAFLLLFSFGSCVLAQEIETRDVGSFRGIKSATGIDVYLKKGSKESVRVEVSGTGIKNVITQVSGDYLKIHMDEGRYNRSRTVKVYVTYVELTKLSCSSASSIYADGIIKARSLDLSASSAGSIDVGVEVEALTASASSAAEIELRGKAKRVELEASSAAKINGYDLEADEADVSASSAGSIRISVGQKIDARASSGADIRYRGNPVKTNTNSSSGGSVKKSS